MTIYKIYSGYEYKPELVSAEAKETASLYIVAGTYNYKIGGTRLRKSSVHLSARDAWDKYRDRIRIDIVKASERVSELQALLKRIESEPKG